MAKLNMLYRYIYGLVLKKVHGIIKFSQKSFAKIIYWYKKWKMILKRNFFKSMYNAAFGKTM